MNILDYVKPLVDEIYRREPYYDNDIVVQPNDIVIKDTRHYSRFTTIQLTDDYIFNIILDIDGDIMEFERETIEQVVDFVLE